MWPPSVKFGSLGLRTFADRLCFSRVPRAENTSMSASGVQDGEVMTMAISYVAAGLSTVPIAADGSKRPAIDAWKRLQKTPPTEKQVRAWWSDGDRGIGIIGGAVSGLEQLDFDTDAATIFPAWCQLVEAEAPGLVAALSVSATPNDGYHVRYRCTACGKDSVAASPSNSARAAPPSCTP
jgi:putative DNA primase/helicase